MSIGNINVEEALRNVQELMQKEKLSPSMKSALQIILLLVTILLERKGLNSKNSSKPPSSDPHRKKTLKEAGAKKRGGQKGHPGTTLQKVEDPDVITELKVDRTLLLCGKWERKGHEVRQVFDLDISTLVTEYRAEVFVNERGEKLTAPFPPGVTASVQYGEGVKAHAVYLSKYQMLPCKRIEEYFSDQIGLPLSAGTLDNFNVAAHERLEWFEPFVRERLMESPLIHADETGININGKTHWMHVHATTSWTYLSPHEKRGREAMDSMEVLPAYRGILCHDHWKPYYSYEEVNHALCNAHHLRELEWAFEGDGQQWAGQMQKMLLAMNQDKIDGGGIIAPPKSHHWKQGYRELLIRADLECPPPPEPERKEGEQKRRGRIKRSKARNLLERLRDYEEDVLRFMDSKEVAFTNNEAEQSLRMTKVQQKISGCFRSFRGAETYCRIRSYLSSARKQGFTASDSMKALFQGVLSKSKWYLNEDRVPMENGTLKYPFKGDV